MMAATSICSSNGATTAKGPRLQEARGSIAPDQAKHMEVPVLANKRLIDLAKELIEVRFHDRHLHLAETTKYQERQLLTRKLGKVFQKADSVKTSNPGYRLLRARGAENETRAVARACSDQPEAQARKESPCLRFGLVDANANRSR